MLLCKKIRLQVSEQDAATLEMMQGKCRGLYNWWVMKLTGWRALALQDAKKTLAESRTYDPDIDQVYGKLLAEVYFRLDKAMQAFFKRVAKGETPGFPRVRPRHQFFTLCYPAMYVKVEGNTVLLPTGGGRGKKDKPYPTIVAGLTETPPAGYKEVAISRDARGHYHASFVYRGTGSRPAARGRSWPLIWASRRWQPASTSKVASITSAASRAISGTTSSWTRFAPSGTAAKRNRVATFTSRRSTSGFQNRSATNGVTVCTKPLISSLTNWLKELW